jgi:TonB-dependent SusC/RagA subfamily outer membrane receptor
MAASMGYSVTGKAAGLGIFTLDTIGGPGAGAKLRLRRVGSLSGGGKPLIVVDGIPSSNLDIDPNTIGDITVLKDAAATALYGSQAANGVILITTKHKTQNMAAQDTGARQSNADAMRKNFSDYAYWQPKLITDINGKASFTVTYPDDITNWHTFVAAINGQKQTGFSEKEIKSFKPVSANLVSPLFAVRGDQLNLIGKVLNYSTDTAKVSRSFSYNGKLIMNDGLQVKNSRIDTMSVTAEGTDSLTFEYSIKRAPDYFDGELRKIPLIEQGTQETKGTFAALEKDTTVNIHFDPAMGPVTFRAEASLLPTLLAETEKLRTYQYLCNEQLASKLIGLLAEKRIKSSLKEPFQWDKNIEQLIKKLLENRRADGTWGWWKNTDEEPWINLHVIEAFIEAKQQGFYVQLDGQKLVDFLVLQLESYKGTDKLTCLEILKQLSVKVDYQKYCDSLTKHIQQKKDASNYDKFRVILLKQQAGIPVSIDSILNKMHHTMFGNVYWGEESYRFFDNSIQLTVLAYKILKNEGKHPELLAKIRGYFLEQRRTGDWRNTYETSLILETILPDVLVEGRQVRSSTLILSGAKSETVSKFPYTSTFTGNELSIAKTGTLPVYITGYQQFWNKNPQKVSKDFAVNAWFEHNGDKVAKLKGGEKVELKSEIKVKGDADYVMINIPIPAGCSYESKDQYWQNEVHREYFKDRVSIFSRKLKEGTYTFTVELMPRYGGNYHLNPAKAEMMYFPVFYGREGMKKVAIQ